MAEFAQEYADLYCIGTRNIDFFEARNVNQRLLTAKEAQPVDQN